MAEDFEFKTRHQFHPLIEKKNRWIEIQDHEVPKKRFAQLLGPQWAYENWALHDTLRPETWSNHSTDPNREEQLKWHHLAARRIYGWAHGSDSLSTANFLELHHLLVTGNTRGVSKFRENDIKSICEGHEPMEAVLVPEVVENAMDWFSAESFHQMHEVEKAALMLAKLIDIHPFEEANGITIRLTSSFYLLQAGYPPAVLSGSKAGEYAIAIENAIRFHTQPLINLLTDSVYQALTFCLDESPPPPTLKVLG